MAGSFEKIDYSLRPAKYAERRMLLQVFRKLAAFQPVETYSYVGFGSVWFADFILLHRAIGVTDLLSIEREKAVESRIRANVPFSSVNLAFDEASKVLPDLDWRKRHFVWLDYDDPLTADVLLDVQTVVRNAASGTLLAVTLNGHKAKEIIETTTSGGEVKLDAALEQFQSRFGRARVAQDVSADDLIGWPFARLSRKIVDEEIEQVLAVRNSKPGVEQMVCTSVCDIEYQDGARMTTAVRVLSTANEAQQLAGCELDKLDFLPAGKTSVRIEIPKLTLREIRALEQQLPRKPGFDRGGVPASDADALARFYRYLPNFAVLET